MRRAGNQCPECVLGDGNVCCVPDQNPSPNLRLVTSASSDDEHAAVLTIKDVAGACGLPQPVIAQMVPRTWTDAGWMYTHQQLQMAVGIAQTINARSTATFDFRMDGLKALRATIPD